MSTPYQNDQAPPGYEDAMRTGPYLAGSSSASHDPRSSSMHSLVPERAEGRRTLLLIYIHGFMGNETSFQSFPAHVHNLVSILVADTHVVHTKLYPRYKSRRALDLVANDFSEWLAPHESQNIDAILLGHSMGGLLSAEVILLNPRPPPGNQAFRHRFLGTINFDVPFLGMHPGVVTSGLASIFRSSPSPPASPNVQAHDAASASSVSMSTIATDPSPEPSRVDTLYATPSDPNYNPKFANDINIPIRKGWRSTMHFINKHSDGLRQATKQYVKSHVEFGGAMADYRGLHVRYNKLRCLEDTDEYIRRTNSGKDHFQTPRVRFVNYYTACHGVSKKPKQDKDRLAVTDSEQQILAPSSRSSFSQSRPSSPRISVEEFRDDGQIVHVSPTPVLEPPSPSEVDMPGLSLDRDVPVDSIEDRSDLETLDTRTTGDSSLDADAVSQILGSTHVQMPIWPPLPPEPAAPTSPNLAMHSDKHVQAALKKEHDRKMKQWKQEMKDRESTLADRKIVEDKIRKAAAKEIEKKQKADATKKESKKESKNKKKEIHAATVESVASASTAPSTSISRTTTNLSTIPTSPSITEPPFSPDTRSIAETAEGKTKEPKDKRFCVIPSKRPDGSRDETWVRVFMHGVDEVGAHCGLFFPNETYERLVGDVGSKIEEWVREQKA